MPTTLTPDAASPRLESPLPGWPQFGEAEIAAAAAVLRSGKVNYWTGGEGKAFEQEYARALGVKYAIAAANGTVTLEMALQALGAGPGDEVVVTPRSFIASASCVVTVGARPVFADVDRDSGNLTAATIAAALTPRTKGVIVVHLGGVPCEMDAILPLAAERSLFVIEDCAQAHGAEYRGRPVGSFGQVASFSFCQDKIITTGGEGGLLATNDEALWAKLWSLKEHGKSYAASFTRTWPPGFRWLHESEGSNHRMTEMQAAIGRVALRELPARLAQRRRNAARLAEVLRACAGLRVPATPPHSAPAPYKFCSYVRPEKLRSGWTRDRLMSAIAARGVPCFTGSCGEIYLEKAFTDRKLGPPARLPVARELGETSLQFLVHPTITDALMPAVAQVVAGVLAEAFA